MTVSSSLARHLRQRMLRVAAIAAMALPAAFPVNASDVGDAGKVESPANGDEASVTSKADQLFGAIVKVSTRSVPNARSSESLGAEREGTGVVIGDGGLVLTIGYLIVEADDVKVTDSKGRAFPAHVVGYDYASGFGLVRTAIPLDAKPIPLGESGKTEEREPVMIASAAGDGAAFAWIVSKRRFTGNWEYQLDSALYTSPPASHWSERR